MAKSTIAAACAALTERLIEKVGELGTARDKSPTRASASVRHESLIVDVWSLRFQIAQLQLAAAKNPDQQQRWHAEAVIASREIAEHEKRLVVARKAKIDDKETDAEEHEQEQEGLAGRLLLLAKR